MSGGDGDGWYEYHGCHGGRPIAKPLFVNSVQDSISREQEREREQAEGTFWCRVMSYLIVVSNKEENTMQCLGNLGKDKT